MNEQTYTKLRRMRLPELAAQYRNQAEDPDTYASLSFDERLTLLVDAEFDARINNKINRLMKDSGVPDRTAHIAGIEYLPQRHLDPDLMRTLQTNDFIRKGQNVMLIGATGCGKTYIACALANNACRNEYRTRYYRLSEFFAQMEAARLQGIYNEVMEGFRKIPLIVFDDFLLLPATEAQQQDLLILLRTRDEDRLSTVLCSQVAVAGWHAQLGSGGIADTLLDRLTSNGYEINIDGEISMRRRHSRI